MPKRPHRESDMYPAVRDWLLNEKQCTKVYAEVRDIDVVGIQGVTAIAVELKNVISMKLLEQAIDRIRLATYVYICVPRRIATRRSFIIDILAKQFGFGLISYANNTKPKIKEHIAPCPTKAPLTLHKSIHKLSENAIGGATPDKRNSPYQQVMTNVRKFLEENTADGTWISVHEILKSVETHYARPVSGLTSALQAVWNQSWCESAVINRRRVFRYRNRNT